MDTSNIPSYVDMPEQGMDRRVTHVEEELNSQAENISYLEQAVVELHQRLTTVLTNIEDTSKIVGEPQHPALVPLAETLRGNNDRLRYIRNQLVSIFDRLEL